MKHKLTLARGVQYCARVPDPTARFARSMILTAILLGASPPAMAQMTVSVVASDDMASETPADDGAFTIHREGESGSVTVRYSVSGTASPGNDYKALSGQTTLGSGQSEASIPVDVSGDDGVFEGDETVTVTLLDDDPEDDVVVEGGSATVTIIDSTYSVTASRVSNAVEDPAADGELLLSLDATNESGNAIVLHYTVAGTAAPAVDYQALSGIAEIPVGSSAASIKVVPLDDDEPEGEETVQITLTATSDSRLLVGDPNSASLTISDGTSDEEVATNTTVSVEASDPDAAESPASNGEFRVRRVEGDMDREITVFYDVSGTASPDSDYASLPGSVTLEASQSEATVAVSVKGNDSLFEGNETVTVTLRENESAGISVNGSSATVTIADSPHSVTASRGSNASESPLQAGHINVSLDARNESGKALKVNYSVGGTATAGSDYQSLSGEAVIATGTSSASVNITPLDDDVPETEETVEITLTATSDTRAPVGDPAIASVIITDGDDDQPKETNVAVTASDANAAESPANDGQFRVRRVSGDSSRSVSIQYDVSGTATGGADYPALSGEVTLPAEEPEVNIDVRIEGDDGLFEGSETVTLTLREDAESGLRVSGGSATVTIQDSEYRVSAASRSNATESPVKAGEFVLSLGARNESGDPLDISYSVAGTATPDTDYDRLSGLATIAPGSNSTTVSVAPREDDLLEGAETVVITLTGTSNSGAPVGNPDTASLTIGDADLEGDDDGDGVSNSRECPDITACRDTDKDGEPDYQDSDDDGDGIPTTEEGAPDQDTDGDSTADYLDDDDDGDGRLTQDEDANEDGDGNPATDPIDSDGDGVPNYLDANDQAGPLGDLDGDGLTNDRENELGTNPERADTDSDGVGDAGEVDDGTDPLDHQSFADADGDLVPDVVETAEGSDPNDANNFLDRDAGGAADHIEVVTFGNFGLTPTDAADGLDDSRDFDGDGLPDRLEIVRGSAPDSADSPANNGAGDDSANGISNAIEQYLASVGIESVDALSDFDRDGYPDAMEVAHGMNPLAAAEKDADEDGVPDILELLAGRDIEAGSDTDADGVPDAREFAIGSDPLDANQPAVNGAIDDDSDGVSNAIEQLLQTLGVSGNPDASTDSDEDGISDADEIRFGTNPFLDEQPAVWIQLKQDGVGPVSAVSTSAGTARATAMLAGHQVGSLTYNWSGSDNAILAVVSGGRTGKVLSFSPQTLPPGPYNLVVRLERAVGDYRSEPSSVKYTVNVLESVEAAAIADVDNDGIPDAVDDRDARQGFANELQAHSGKPIAAAAGLRLQLGSTARITGAPTALITLGDLAEAGNGTGGSTGNSNDSFDYRSGIFDFEITNLAEAGSAVQVVIPQAGAIGEFPEYRKFLAARGWGGFVEDAGNEIASAAASNGQCPPPGADAWQSGLTPGHDCVRLTIEDGGPNDGDAEEGPNGVIKDPGGVATPKGEVSVGQGGGSLGLVALLLLGLVRLACGSGYLRPHTVSSQKIYPSR